METTNVRVSGIQFPAYLNGRSRAMLVQAFEAAPAPVATPVVPIAAELSRAGVRHGEGVPFAVLYMSRASKKLHMLEAAA